MSYSRSYSEVVSKTVSKTVSISYPASQSGGSVSETVTLVAEIPVDINILVDTNPFDQSVNNCNTKVNLLTGAVVATEAAEIAVKQESSKKIGSAIVSGFFSYIRSEISQQVSELSQKIDAQLMHLRGLAQSCIELKNRMNSDHERISSRYGKIFNDLNKELSNRIFELDRPVFSFGKAYEKLEARSMHNGSINTVAIFGSESSALQSKISSSIAKRSALETINKAIHFLQHQKDLNKTLKKVVVDVENDQTIYIPILMTETQKENVKEHNFYSNPFYQIKENNQIMGKVDEQFKTKLGWTEMNKDSAEMISFYLQNEIQSHCNGDNPHSSRVRESINSLAKLNNILTATD